jgi:fibronectin-binding autotransporter adhesin
VHSFLPSEATYGSALFTVGTTNGIAATALSASGNVTGGNILTAGLISATSTITSAATITGGNLATGGTASATGNITGGNILTAGLMSATGAITGSTLTAGGLSLSGNTITSTNSTITIDPNGPGGVDGAVIIAGNLSVQGNVTYIDSNVITTNEKSITLANNVSTGSLADGSGIDVGNATIAYWRFNNATTSWQSNIGLTPAANATLNLGGTSNYWATVYATGASLSGNITGGNILTAGLISATSTITSATTITGGNLATGGTASATGNITGGNILTAGLISATSTITSATTITGGNLATGGTASVTGNITGGNILTAGLISATSTITSATTITGGNLATGGTASATGNITGGNITTAGVLTVNSNNAATAIVNGGTNGGGNIGASGATFNTVYAKATTAQYADLAEKYTADATYAPGTVLVFGGTAEVTVNAVDSDRRVAGVVSTNPGFVMNEGLEGEFAVAIALTGRVPCMVVGPVKKGDLMVAAGLGRARAEADPKVGTVIGKALEDFDGVEGTIEVVVGRF